MTDWTPGDGWRPLAIDEILEGGGEVITYSTGADMRSWVREVPVPPLPTAPYTVIRVTYDPAKTQYEFCLWPDYGWWSKDGGRLIEERITGFEVLAEPTPRVALYEEQQRVVRDVIDAAEEFFDQVRTPGRMRVLSYDLQQALFAHIRGKFGVSS